MTVDKARELEVVEEQTEEEYVAEMVRVYNENRLYDADTGDILEPEMTVSEMRDILDIPPISTDQIGISKEEVLKHLIQATGYDRELAEDVLVYTTTHG